MHLPRAGGLSRRPSTPKLGQSQQGGGGAQSGGTPAWEALRTRGGHGASLSAPHLERVAMFGPPPRPLRRVWVRRAGAAREGARGRAGGRRSRSAEGEGRGSRGRPPGAQHSAEERGETAGTAGGPGEQPGRGGTRSALTWLATGGRDRGRAAGGRAPRPGSRLGPRGSGARPRACRRLLPGCSGRGAGPIQPRSRRAPRLPRGALSFRRRQRVAPESLGLGLVRNIFENLSCSVRSKRASPPYVPRSRRPHLSQPHHLTLDIHADSALRVSGQSL